MRFSSAALSLLALLALAMCCRSMPAQEPPSEAGAAESPAADQPAAEAAGQPADGEKQVTPAEADALTRQATAQGQLVRLSKNDKVWIDKRRKLVVVEGKVTLTRGQLEMFACPEGTKEHESVVAVESKSFVVHAALLAVGAESGHPVRFDPVFQIPTGDVIDVHVLWVDAEGKKHQVRAQEWVRNIESQKAMEHDWVFGGSGFWVDETSGERHYLAEGGDLICVSNFPTATLDLQVKSSQGNANLLFEAFTENIPPEGTRVRLVLIPRKKQAAAPPAAGQAPAGEVESR